MWMVAGFLMLATETLVPGFFLLFFGIGAVFMGFF
jgi:membrane protein implicated in regulation of membrane protease activity